MASDLELSPAAVERGAKELDPNAFTGEGYSPEAAASSRESALASAEAVLTAALRLDDPETVERVAEGVWRSNWKREPVYEWTREVPNTQDTYRRLGRAAITALLGAEPEEAEDAE